MARALSIRSALASVVVAALLVPVSATPAAAADDDLVIPFTTIPVLTPPGGDPSFIVLQPDGAIDITPPAEGRIDPQCVPVDGGIVTCIGAPTDRDPLEDTGVGGLADFLPSAEGDHVAAFGWIVREAVAAISALYDVPADGRIERYAGDQIRGYVITRVIDIFDQYIYGIPLSADEQTTFDFISARFLEVDRMTARFAKEEYDRYMADECRYAPPPAPAFVTEPLGMPTSVTSWCGRLQSQLEQQLAYAPPIPSAESFQTWGAYRNADALGLGAFGAPSLRQDLVDAQNAMNEWASVAALGSTVAAGAIAGALVGSSTVLSTAIATALGSASLNSAAATGAVSTVAAGSAAGVVGIILFAIIGIAVTSVQVAEREGVGTQVNNRLANLLATNDPFALDEQRARYLGLDLRENLDLADPPRYRTDAAVSRILALVVERTSARYGGVFLPDSTELWPDNATTARDDRFEVTDASGTRTVERLTLPVEGVDTTARFNRGWVISDTGTGERAALSFPVILADGTPATVTRTVVSGAGFTLTRVPADGEPSTENVESFEFRDAAGEIVRVGLVPGSTSELAGPTPSAVGPLTPGRTVILRPNPVALDGTFGLDRYLTGYAYEWTVVRHDPVAGAWVEVTSAATYDARFIPQQVGSYRASVLMRDTDPADGVDDDVWGSVDFAVTAPAVDVAELRLVDDGLASLRVEAQFGAQVPENDYVLSVTWPGSIDGGEPVTRSLPLPCIRVDALQCSTVDTSRFADFDSVLSYELPADAALAQGVTVSITDRFGGGLSQRFAIDGAARPAFTAPLVAPSDDQPGLVAFGTGMTTLQVPVGYPGDPNYEIATIVPGVTSDVSLGLVDPETGAIVQALELADGAASARIVAGEGSWSIVVRVVAGADRIGSTIVPLIVQQVTTDPLVGATRATLPFTLELVAAPGDRFRGALATDVDPNDFQVEAVPTIVPYVMGGRADWEEYDGEVCVSLRFTGFPTDPFERCAPAADLLGDDGEWRPIDVISLVPEGLRVGRWEAAVRLPSAERTDATPLVTSFSMRYGAPVIDALVWNPTTRSVTFTTSPSDEAVPVVSTECRLDDLAVDCAAAASGDWPDGVLVPGDRTFTVRVVDAGGNGREVSFLFTVAADEPDPATVTLSSGTIAAGGTLSVVGDGFAPGERVIVELRSEPVVLEELDADEGGAFSTEVVVPVDTPAGEHMIVVTGSTSGRTASAALVVTAVGDPTDPTDPVLPIDPVDPTDPTAPGGPGEQPGTGGLAASGPADLAGMLALAILAVLAGALALRRRTV